MPEVSVNELAQRNSGKSLRQDFVCRLPAKIKSHVDLNSSSFVDLSGVSLTKGERKYYEGQFETLRPFEDLDAVVISDKIIEEDLEEKARRERAIKVSNYANVFLLALKVYATIGTGSMAIAVSTLHSLLDMMAGGILWLTHMFMKNVDIYKYPTGKLRVQPVGIVVFASVMATVGLQVLVQATEELIQYKPPAQMSSSQLVWLYSIMITASAVKLVLWFYCRSSKNEIVCAYAQDHCFDVVSNLGCLVAALLGDAFYWWADPVGAIALAVYTISNWSQSAFENGAVSLVGQSAPQEVLRKLTYLAVRHPQVKRIITVRAYTLGVLYFVEVDVELSEELPLKDAYTVVGSLQKDIKKLPQVFWALLCLWSKCKFLC